MEKKMYSRMAIGRNDNYVQRTFTAETFPKRQKGKIQRLDWVSCPDMEIWALPNLGITVDRFSCPDMNIGVSTTRFPRAFCFKETHAFCSRNMGVHVQCTCAKKLVSSDFTKIMHNYVRKKNAQLSGRQWECLGGFQELGCFGSS